MERSSKEGEKRGVELELTRSFPFLPPFFFPWSFSLASLLLVLSTEHALNNLLQGRYFQPTDMAEIANQLDQEENAELDEDRRISVNMDDSGEYLRIHFSAHTSS